MGSSSGLPSADLGGWESRLLVYAALTHLSSVEPESLRLIATGNRINVLITPVWHFT